jgi:ABC-type thiamine transport system ATPase subunit
MIWVALVIIVFLWIIDLWKNSAWKRARRCQHGISGLCARCQEEAGERARAAEVASAEAKARSLRELDEAFFAIDEATRTKIIDLLEDHWIDANLPDWTTEQMKQSVVKIYRQSLANEGKLMEISGAFYSKR